MSFLAQCDYCEARKAAQFTGVRWVAPAGWIYGRPEKWPKPVFKAYLACTEACKEELVKAGRYDFFWYVQPVKLAKDNPALQPEKKILYDFNKKEKIKAALRANLAARKKVEEDDAA